MFNNRTIVDDSTVLMVSMATRADTGYYTCTATNNVGMSSSTAYLNVFCKSLYCNVQLLFVSQCAKCQDLYSSYIAVVLRLHT